MSTHLRIVLAQLNPVMGDVRGNLAKARAARALHPSADVIVFPELFITGYPPEDLVLKPALQDDAMAAVRELAQDTSTGPAVFMPTPWVEGSALFNAVALLDAGVVQAVRYKVELPNYGVFDEKRVFKPGPMPGPFNLRGVRIGVPICEDIWHPEVAECLAETGAEILLSPNGSPFEQGKEDVRLNLAVARVVETGLPLAYLNQLGGQDELAFDGGSFVINPDRTMAVQMPAWEEAVTLTHWWRGANGWACDPLPHAAIPDGLEAIYHAAMLALRDYAGKNRFPGVVLGLSGGIDSALTAAMAVDALGPDKVRCVMMPSKYTSQESLDDAAECARLLGVHYDTIPIEPAVAAYTELLSPQFAGTKPDTTEENIQSRIRGVILMALSNKFGQMVLTTGNKSEMSVGYATLYGDMCGGYNVLKDIYKMQVFALSCWRNQHRPKGALGPAGRVMPERVIDKPPSAELRANQRDDDSLPPYPVLDDILECLVENEMPVEQIEARGHPIATIKRVEHLLNIAEYKRRQAPPGVKITRKNFGRDRRYPITNKFRDAT